MADFTTIQCGINSNTDASPTWSTALAFGGSAGANELRWANTGGGGASTASASWPYFTRPSSGTATVPEMWACTANTTCVQVATYTGDNTKANVLRWDWDNTGTFAAAPQFSMFGDNTHATPSAGTQPGAQAGSPIVNGHASDTSSKSYAKINAYGNGKTAGGTQHTPAAGSVGTNPSATTGGAGAATPAATPAWLTTWSAAQGWIDYILNGATPQATTAGFWYWAMVLFTGVNMSTGTLTPVVTFQYAYS